MLSSLLWWSSAVLPLLLLEAKALTLPERRRYVLLPWSGDDSKPLGWASEVRARDDASCNVTVAWTDSNGDDKGITVELPWRIETEEDMDEDDTDSVADELASSLWPAGVSGAILSRSPAFVNAVRDKRILELGSGVGLTGWVAGAAAASATLTDHCTYSVKRMQQIAGRNKGNITARSLEWKDEDRDGAEKFDTIIGADIAYYWYLLRPLMDTIQAHLAATSSGDFVMITGGANRECQWDLYKNIKEGCYNQLTDEHEGPWTGQTRMLLYKLQVHKWMDDDDTSVEGQIETVVPMAVLLHERDGCLSFSEWDYAATAKDKEEMLMSF